jgi:hypothetical protein
MTDAVLQEILDRAAIERVLFDYCSGIDRCDEELLRSVYHPGAYDDHGVFKGDAGDFVTFALDSLRTMDLATQHLVSNIRIDLDGDRARVESYLVARHVRDAGEGRLLITFGGRYLDGFERRDGAWKIAHRLVIVDWEKQEQTERARGHKRFTRGSRKPDDLLFNWDDLVKG